ncbi:hypothetical protein A0257_11365 [Hymenobacter psoromatis]|nr:hypothetical protein A0257_11365 [Hymenobacter psoromatis]
MKFLFISLVLASSLAATAQTITAPAFISTCRQMDDDNQQRFCETRDLTMPAPTGRPLNIDGGQNGGITVKGWDGVDVRIRATVQSWGSSQEQAQARAKALSISTAGNTLRASTTDHAAVSFEVFVPRRLALTLNTQNGGISLHELQGTITFHAQNGGVSLDKLGGQVAGNTTNGGLSIALSGRQWEGSGLDVATTNGGITWHLPASYSAQFFTSTNGGGIKTTLPMSKPKGQYREVKASLGAGGQPVRAVTINGGITIEQG